MTNPFRKLWRTAPAPDSGAAGTSEIQPLGNGLLLSERRVVKRHFDPLVATVRYGIAATEERVGIHNFSDKGLCFRSGVRFPIGAAVEIITILPEKAGFGGRKVRYRAHVVRSNMERGEFATAALIYRCETLPQEPKAELGNENAAGIREVIAAEKLEPLQVEETKGQTAKPKPRESRRFSRYNCVSPVQFRMPDTGVITSGELANLSLAGCYVETAKPCPLGATVEIVVQAGRARIYTHGQVKAVKENHGMAVEFAGELIERLQRLPRFVQMVSSGHPATCQNN